MNKIEKQKILRIKNKKFALEYLGNICNKCGNTRALEFDHINSKNKIIKISNLFSSSKTTLLKELIKCQLLCKNCHQSKTLIDLNKIAANAQHGTSTGYTHGKCRCVECKKWHREYIYEWRRKIGKY